MKIDKMISQLSNDECGAIIWGLNFLKAGKPFFFLVLYDINLL